MKKSNILVFSLLILNLGCASSRKMAHVADGGLVDPLSWVELGPNSQILARAVTSSDECPHIQIDGKDLSMELRAAPTAAFKIRVCEKSVPANASSAVVQSVRLPLPSKDPKKIVFIGDTGCRLKTANGKTDIQACNDGKAWPFASISQTVADSKPDLIVHVGDYAYRESPCPANDTSCAGSPSGENWDVWYADFFRPAQALLHAAPWVFVRGNHEICERAGEGWFRFLEPGKFSACENFTPPYLIQLGSAQLVVMDSAMAADIKAPQDLVSKYSEQFEQIEKMPLSSAWLITHKPIWSPPLDSRTAAVSSYPTVNQTLQAAIKNHPLPAIHSAIAGHFHLFEALDYDAGHPSQLVVGNSGTKLTPAIYKDWNGLEIDGVKIKSSAILNEFGYFVMEKTSASWTGTEFNGEGQGKFKCDLHARSLTCN